MNKDEEYFYRGNEKEDAGDNKGAIEDYKNLIKEFFKSGG